MENNSLKSQWETALEVTVKSQGITGTISTSPSNRQYWVTSCPPRCRWGLDTNREFKGELDHVHLLISVNPKVQPSKLVNNLKTVSSRLIRKEYAEHFNQVYRGKPIFWSRSYCIISCGGVPISVL